MKKVKNYTFKETKDKNLFRVVDLNGDWTHYFHKGNNQYLRSVNYILNGGFKKGEGFDNFVKNNTPEEIDRKLKTAGEKGDAIHDMISKIITNGGTADREDTTYNEQTGEDVRIKDDEWFAILSWVHFWLRHEPMVVDYEFPIFNTKEGYAGTADAILILTKECDIKDCDCHELIGKTGLWDWKSGNGLYEDYPCQLAAYANGENLQKKIDYTANLRLGTKHIRTNGYEIKVYDDIKQNFKEFLAAKTIHNTRYKPFNPEKEIQEIPQQIKLNIKFAFNYKKATKAKKITKKTKK